MTLVVGHNCPGCGLDTPQLACEACGASIVWDRENGSHCAACGRSAATIACPECGLRAELDKRHAEYRARVPARPVVAVGDPDDDDDDVDEDDDVGDDPPPPPPALARLHGAFTASPVRSAFAIAAALGLHGALLALVLGGGGAPDRKAPSAPAIVVDSAPVAPSPPARAHADALPPEVLPHEALLLDDLPVPLPPPRPGIASPSQPRLARPPPPRAITRAVREGVQAHAPQRREGWLQRVWRSGTVSPAGHSDPIRGESPGPSAAASAGGGGNGGGGNGGGAGR